MDLPDHLDLDVVLRHLPSTETQRYLFKRLDLETLQNARCVNKLWQSLIDPILEFHVDLSDKSKKYVSAFGVDRKTSLTTSKFQGKYPAQGFSLDANILRVTVNVLENEGNLATYGVESNIGLTEYNFRRLVKDFYFVDKFQIASLAIRTFGNTKLLERIHLPNVTEIIVTFFDSGFHQLLPFMKNYFPKLKSVNIANVAEVRMDRPCLYSRIFGFIARHEKSLEVASLIFPEGVMDDNPLRTSVYRQLRKDHKMPRELYKNVLVTLENMQLKKLIWDVSMLEGTARYNMGSTLLRSQTHLTDLLLDNLHSKDRALWNSIEKVLSQCSETLNSVTIGGCMCGPPALAPSKFSCAWLKNCKHLESLEMVICGMLVDDIEDLPKAALRSLNLGHMLRQDQIEFIALNMVNLKNWVLPQHGCKLNIMVPKINTYLFEAILHLPNLTQVNLLSDCSDKEKILEFVENEPGIQICGHTCSALGKNSNLGFHICRTTFKRNHAQLESFIKNHRTEILQDLDMSDGQIVELFIRNLILGENAYLLER